MSGTKLGGIQKRGGAPAGDAAAKYAPNAGTGKPTKLTERLANGRRGETVEVPELGEMRLELLGARESQEVEAAVYRNLAALGVENSVVTADRFELERAVLTIARAARDPADKALVFGTEAEWQSVDNQLIMAAWRVYGDVKERLDPHEDGLTDVERVLIETAIKKKRASALENVRCREAVRLSAFYGCPAADLTATELAEFGVAIGLLTLIHDDDDDDDDD